MAKKKTDLGRRAWNLLRLVLLWARKGGIIKRGLMMDLRRLLPNHIKNLCNAADRDSIRPYGERELSFDKTPLFHFKMHRPPSLRFQFPCLNPPHVDFDFDFKGDYLDDIDGICNQGGRNSFLIKADDDEKEEDYGGDWDDTQTSEMFPCQEEEGNIDLKAEKFIANFYEQIKLQRQISYLQYNEMLTRGAS
ncbi:PREDICTED: uncharacterized protein LOC104605126 [Nelumbo nucifera]|uniref:Cotton fiber protein n=2 Tax=Nelumbo nucifera TaxID=4432 RepID=A0A822YQ67_NELNU|nr:PREDICTED: uncharacterized protein LOC104605126 [Nelumbo nucifera]DAD33175.1 TPA_asm: hypothetical protein HUJ06_012026 [Nelumbo nucifera]